MVEDVDYYAEAESMAKMVEEAKKNGMDFAVRCMAASIKVDAPGKQSNPVIEEIRDFVLKANVDFGKLTKTFMFKGPVVFYEYSRGVKQGCYTDSKVKGPRLVSGGLSFPVTPLIRLEMFNEFERRIMSLTLVKGSSFVPEVWSALSPELRLFIVSGETVFPDVKAGDELSVEVLEMLGFGILVPFSLWVLFYGSSVLR
ncbi:hypothetical protein FOZ60_012589 [Perkinsus olseni]|uniref:Uncharacterized protein n=1 Tax=Perkinsus olseni TaxID=32597 RepID=A0A7J6NB85_PEROL|nr:hypothetical protein FOZ60_012589 [Perkinsus olseni]